MSLSSSLGAVAGKSPAKPSAPPDTLSSGQQTPMDLIKKIDIVKFIKSHYFVTTETCLVKDKEI